MSLLAAAPWRAWEEKGLKFNIAPFGGPLKEQNFRNNLFAC